jgi:glutamate/tyrosine decarboxylase-like PLP-dependent enzyme
MLFHNPNLTSKEVAKVANHIETEAIQALAKMIGYDKNAKGHFTSGGTVANIEGLWRARYRTDHFISFALYLIEQGFCKRSDFWNLCHMGWDQYNFKMKSINKSNHISEELLKKYSPVLNGPWDISLIIKKITHLNFNGPVVLVPGNKHFSWQKATSLMGLGDSSLWPIGLDENGVLSLDSLKLLVQKAQKENRPVLAVISVAGTTELGQFDPVDKVQDYLDELKTEQGIFIWHHIDAAWGGFFSSILGDKDLEKQFDKRPLNAIKSYPRAESITIDPHKLGYVPYSCGAFLTKNADAYRVSSFAAPYIQVDDNSPWAYTLEGSRSGNGACAVWLTANSIGFNYKRMGRL